MRPSQSGAPGATDTAVPVNTSPRTDAHLRTRGIAIRNLHRIQTLTSMIPAAARGFTSDVAERYDIIALSETAITAVVVEQGVSTRPGATRDQAIQAVASVAERMHDDADEAQHLGRWVVGWLLNDAGNNQPRTVTYRDPASGYGERTFDVQWLYQHVTEDRQVVLRATTEAIVALHRGLTGNLADASVAAEAILAAQMAEGRIAEANEQAIAAEELSRSYAADLYGFIERTRRDITSVDWKNEVEQVLSRARTHIRDRQTNEARLKASAIEQRDEHTDPTGRSELHNIVETLSRCLATHDGLLEPVISAYDVFLAEQKRQRLTRSASSSSVPLQSDVLPELLSRTADDDLTGLLDTFVTPLAGPAIRPLVSMRHTIELLLDRRETAEVDVEPPEPDVDLGEPPDLAYTDPALLIAAEDLLAEITRPTTLSELLASVGGVASAQWALTIAACRTALFDDDHPHLDAEVSAVTLPATAAVDGRDVTLTPSTQGDPDAA